jgi:plastocyanin
MMRTIRVLLLVTVVVGLAGCGGSSKKSSSSSASLPAAAPDTITIKGFAFSPKTVTVDPGATVSVINADSVDHTVTGTGGATFNTNHVHGGTSSSFIAPTTPGTYHYQCNIHQYMKGTLVVR